MHTNLYSAKNRENESEALRRQDRFSVENRRFHPMAFKLASPDLQQSRAFWHGAFIHCRLLRVVGRRRRWRNDAERDVTGAGYDSSAERAPRSGHRRNHFRSHAGHAGRCRHRLPQTPTVWVLAACLLLKGTATYVWWTEFLKKLAIVKTTLISLLLMTILSDQPMDKKARLRLAISASTVVHR